MKNKTILLLFLSTLLLAGCAETTRLVTDTVTAGGGALLGDKLSHGNPYITAASGGAGLLVGEGLNYANNSNAKKAYSTGFDKGRSDAVKQQYWLMVNQQKAVEDSEHASLYEIPIPEQEIDGVILKPTTKILRIEE